MKLPVNTIPGWNDELSAEEKLKLITEHDFNVVDKKSFDTASSDLAKFKKESTQKMTDAAAEKATLENRVKELESKFEAASRENTINKYKASYLSSGYDEESAAKAAEALANGDTDTVFQLQQAAIEAAKNNAIAEKVRSMGAPASGSPQGQAFTLDQIRGMSPTEINKNWDAISKTLENS